MAPRAPGRSTSSVISSTASTNAKVRVPASSAASAEISVSVNPAKSATEPETSHSENTSGLWARGRR